MDQQNLELIEVQKLPSSLQYLISCIGIESTFILTCLYGGRQKYIPKTTSRTSLSEIIPQESLQALIDNFSGTSLEIPKNDHFIRQIRNKKIKMDISLGKSRSEIAKRYGLSIRQITNICRHEENVSRVINSY